MTNNLNWGEAFYDHLLKYLGNPVKRAVFRQSEAEPLIQVLEFDNVFPRCKVFCSFGASNYSDVLGVPAEVILPCDNGWEVAGGLLANALFYMMQHRMALGAGVAVGLGPIASEFARKFGKTAIYFTSPFGLPAEFSIVRNNDHAGRVYLALFISQAEFDYFCDRGAAEFESHLQRARVDPYEISRHSSI